MNILLIDSSSKTIEFSYYSEGKFIINETLPSDKNADMLIYFIKNSFNKRNIDLKEIRFVSLSNGPGSFTGLRIGSAIAKGICFCTDSKLIEISTLDIIANKFPGGKKVISMIFSGMRSGEFYYCEYEKINEKLIRLSGYKKDKFEKISKDGYYLVINEKIKEDFIKEFNITITEISELSDLSNSNSHLELALESIKNGVFSNYNDSEPFYMTEFVPKI